MGISLRVALALLPFALSPCAAAEDLAGGLSVEATIPRSGDFMGFGFDSLWMMSGTVLIRVNPSDNSVVEIPVAGAVGRYRGVAIGEQAVWVPDTGGKTIYKIDPQTNQIALKIPAELSGGSEGSVGVGAGSVWAVTGVGSDTRLTRYDAKSGDVQATIAVSSGCSGVIFDFGSVWITGTIEDELYRVDPEANRITATIPLRTTPRFLASGEGSVWVLNQGDGSVQRIDGKSGELLATVEAKASGSGGDIVVGGDFVWVTTHAVPVIKIDPRTNALVGKFREPGVYMGDAIRYGDGSLWVSGTKIFRIKPP